MPENGPLRICIAMPYDLCREGGVKRHCVHLARSLRALGDEVDIIGPRSQKGELEAGMYGFGGVVSVSWHGSVGDLGIAPPWQIWRHLRSRRYDVLHVHEPVVPALNYWALYGAGPAARVCTFHSFDEDEPARTRRTRTLGSKLCIWGYDRGIAVSPAAADFARSVWKRPLALIPNGVPTSVFVPPEADPPSDPSRPVRLLFVGHFRSPRKGLPYLLDAYRQLRGRGVALTLDVIGAGNPGEPPEEMPGVTYHGPISVEEELARHYARSDIFIAPATGQESFGIVLLEAMAAERAIICSDIPGYRYAVGGNAEPVGTRLIPPGSVEGLAAAIADLAAAPELRRRMGEANRRRALTFDWERIARQVRGEYLAAIETRRAVARHRAPAPG